VIRVLHVLEAIEGGTARHLADLVSAARNVEHLVAVPSTRSHGVTDVLALEHIARCAVAVDHVSLRRSVSSPANLLALRQLRTIVRRRMPDVLHGHSSIGGVAARVTAATTRLPAVYTPNGIQTGRLALGVERMLSPWTTRLIAVSDTEAADARRWGLARPERICTVANGIALDPEPGRDLGPLLDLPPTTPLVGTIARLVEQKSPLLFVRTASLVAARAPEAHFVLIGSGPLEGEVDDAVRAAGLIERFHRIPELPAAGSYLGSLAVFCLLSRFEGAPYSPLEAMRAGVPVVLTDVVGNHDVLGDDDGAGYLVPWDEPARAADAIVALLSDASLRDRVVAQARERLASRFDIRLMASATAQVYEEAAATARS
jgi:glycosyltransferase involved in cell wall biosynthesis